jgi:hypothetical protein
MKFRFINLEKTLPSLSGIAYEHGQGAGNEGKNEG